MTILNSLQEVLGSVVDTLDEVGETLSVGTPKDNDLVKSVGSLEITGNLLAAELTKDNEFDVPNVLADLLNMLSAGLGTLDQIVGAIPLISSDEVWIIDGWQWSHGSHLLGNQLLQSWLEDGSAVHGISQVHGANVPTTNDQIIWVNHWQNLMERNVDILGGFSISAELHGRAHEDRTIVVGGTRTLTSGPGEGTLVSKDTSGDGGAIVTTPSNKHHTDLWNRTLNLKVIDSLLWSSYVLSISSLGDRGSAVSVLGLDFSLGVDDIW
jgi:hypothetical protein